MARHKMSKTMDKILKSNLNIQTFLGLIVYFAKYTRNLNKTKLNKLMFFTDFGYYSFNNESITGARYIHMPFGPVPEEIDVYLAELEENEIIDININFTSFLEYRINTKEDIDFHLYTLSGKTLLSDKYLTFAEAVNRKFGEKTASYLSDFSHELTPYKVTREYHPISYELITRPQPFLNNQLLYDYIVS